MFASPATRPAPALTVADRCDRCGAQAYVRVLTKSNSELLFCAHHGREHKAAINAAELSFQDQTDRLFAEEQAMKTSTHVS